MGILNVTPDSFFDRGRYGDPNAAVERAAEMAGEGADIIDIGGEKAGPGEPVSAEEETARVVPVIRAVRHSLGLPISVDTFKPSVARAAVEAGAEIINNIDGFQDPEMRRVAAETGAAAVVMHIQGRPRVANPAPVYGDAVAEVIAFLERQANLCRADGIAADSIVIDPGPDFGKNTEHSLATIRHLDRIAALPYPVLLAVSRKRFIGEVLSLDVGDRLEGSLAVAAWGVLKGARLIRAHDIKATRRVVAMVEAVLRPELAAGAGA